MQRKIWYAQERRRRAVRDVPAYKTWTGVCPNAIPQPYLAWSVNIGWWRRGEIPYENLRFSGARGKEVRLENVEIKTPHRSLVSLRATQQSLSFNLPVVTHKMHTYQDVCLLDQKWGIWCAQCVETDLTFQVPRIKYTSTSTHRHITMLVCKFSECTCQTTTTTFYARMHAHVHDKQRWRHICIVTCSMNARKHHKNCLCWIHCIQAWETILKTHLYYTFIP